MQQQKIRNITQPQKYYGCLRNSSVRLIIGGFKLSTAGHAIHFTTRNRIVLGGLPDMRVLQMNDYLRSGLWLTYKTSLKV